MVSEEKAKELIIQNVYRCIDNLGYGNKVQGAFSVFYDVKGKLMTVSEYLDYCIKRELKKFDIKV